MVPCGDYGTCERKLKITFLLILKVLSKIAFMKKNRFVSDFFEQQPKSTFTTQKAGIPEHLELTR